jgi:hypothetical protein
MHATPTPEAPAFLRQQYAFAAHIRDPRAFPRPADVPERRMAVYRELFFNNVEGFLATGFPVLRGILADARWEALARDFFARHRCRTPLFLEIGREFLDYLEHERGLRTDDPPFLAELAHYEWVELALAVSDADRDGRVPADPAGDLLVGHPLVSPLAWPLRYRFPVHRIDPDFQPTEPGERPTCLLVYRDPSDRVRFLEISEVTHALLALLRAEPALAGRAALMRIAGALARPDPKAVVGFGLALLTDLRARGLILGTRRGA